jgi:hypothetical protein
MVEKGDDFPEPKKSIAFFDGFNAENMKAKLSIVNQNLHGI